jgi:DNA-binding transcriptional regulator YdaS (Cro superfamily)
LREQEIARYFDTFRASSRGRAVTAAAAELGVSESHIEKLASGSKPVPPDLALRIEKAARGRGHRVDKAILVWGLSAFDSGR